MTLFRSGTVWRILAVAAVAILVLANAHMVYVATATQPDCVAHVKAGDPGSPAASFSAARSSC